jgi:hypothetical protein
MDKAWLLGGFRCAVMVKLESVSFFYTQLASITGFIVRSVKRKIFILFAFNQLTPLSLLMMVNMALSGFFTTCPHACLRLVDQVL